MLYLTKLITKALAAMLACLETHEPLVGKGERGAVVVAHTAVADGEHVTLTITATFTAPLGTAACLHTAAQTLAP
jgi:hypothetical protein